MRTLIIRPISHTNHITRLEASSQRAACSDTKINNITVFKMSKKKIMYESWVDLQDIIGNASL